VNALEEQRTLTLLAVLADRIRELTDEVDSLGRNEDALLRQVDSFREMARLQELTIANLEDTVEAQATELSKLMDDIKGRDNRISFLQLERDAITTEEWQRLPPTWNDVQEMMGEAEATYINQLVSGAWVAIIRETMGGGATLLEAIRNADVGATSATQTD
jgi:chromosome segregation ATPase